MAYENIRSTKKNLTSDGKYFYVFNESSNVLEQRTSKGDIVFTYPITVTLGVEVVSLEYDGLFFWTLQRTSSTWNIEIKKWIIQNSLCNLLKTYTFNNDSYYRYDSNTFVIEHYNTTFATTSSGNATYVDLISYVDKIEPGDVITLGPNYNGYFEEMTVTGTLSDSSVGFNTFTEYEYSAGDQIIIHRNMWIFNNYFSPSDGTGTLLKYKIPNGELLSIIKDSEYDNIVASTFSEVSNTQLGTFFSILYIKTNTLKFLNPNSVSVDTSMTIDNIRVNNSTIIQVYDMVVIGNSLFRLQIEAMYFGTDNSWTTYNYQVSPIRNYIDSVTADITPAILPANGFNIAEVRTIVNDQYAIPLYYAAVSCTDNDDVGYMTQSKVYTWLDGVATNNYRAGVAPKHVTIEVTATQYY